MENPLTIYGVSKKLGLSPNYISHCCKYHPERIPKFFILHKLHRWKESDVEYWIRQNKGDNCTGPR